MTKTDKAKCLDPVWEGTAHCATCAVRRYTMFAGVPAASFDHLLKPIDQIHYPARAHLYRENDSAEFIYVIRHGLVKLEHTTPRGELRVVRLLGQGDTVGLEAVLDRGNRYGQSAITLREVEVCRIPHENLIQLEREHPAVSEAVMRHWQRQLEAADRVIVDFSTGKVRERVARVLLRLAYDSRQQKLADMEMLGVEDIAALVGVTPESVSRCLADMKRERLLVKSAAHRFVFDWAGLTEASTPDLET